MGLLTFSQADIGVDMKSTIVVAALVALGAALPVRAANAQMPCSIARAVVDSARDDALSVLTSGRPLVEELRREQNMTNASDISHVSAVNERFVCAKIAAAFEHTIPPGIGFAVLKIGPLYYARDPDQRRSTGVFTDTTFKVLMRLGAEIPAGRSPNQH
jgi:hypothetical protein